MEDFLRMLKLLAVSYEDHVCDVRGRVRVPRLTPENLPDELILDILEYDPSVRSILKDTHSLSSDITIDLSPLIKYSHVCSRFRNLIMSRPPLPWGLIPLNTDLPPNIIHFIAHNSGTHGITVHTRPSSTLKINAQQEKPLESLIALVAHCSKWTSAKFETVGFMSTKLESQFSREELPNIHTFEAQGWRKPFCMNWSMPRLNECSLQIQTLAVADVVSFLASTPRLTSLNLRFYDTISSDSTTSTLDHQIGEACLPMLEYMTFSSFSREMGEHFFEAISCPTLKNLDYHGPTQPLMHLWKNNPMLHTCSLDLQNLKEADIISFLASAPNLINLDLAQPRTANNIISFQQEPEVYVGDIERQLLFEDVLGWLPATIEKIKISNMSFRSFRTSVNVFDVPTMKYPNLKSLDIELCRLIAEVDFFGDLASVLNRMSVTLEHFRAPMEVQDEEDGLIALRTAGVLIDIHTVV